MSALTVPSGKPPYESSTPPPSMCATEHQNNPASNSSRLNLSTNPEWWPDRIVVINLPDRGDRRKKVEQLLRRENIDFLFSDGVRVELSEVFPEEHAKVGWADKKHLDRSIYIRGLVGCKRAHLRCLEEAQSERLESLLIMEDDVAFRPGWRDLLMRAVSELPDGWLQLYFSGHPFNPPERVGTHLLRLTGAWQTTAILYSRRGIEMALECVRSAQCEVDHWMAVELHPLGNSYMVDPQITYQSAGFSDCRGEFRGELDCWAPHTIVAEKESRKKIFEIGHGKTGSTSLFAAMQRLGFKSTHWPIPHSRDWMTRLLLGEDFRFDFVESHQFIGNGIERFYRHLDEYYPDSKFILLVRDEDSWLESYRRHLSGTRNLTQHSHFYAYMLSAYGIGNFDPTFWREAFRKHNYEVQEYFRNRPEKLLVMDICAGQGYETLCPFLGLPICDDAFPKENVAKRAQEITSETHFFAAEKPHSLERSDVDKYKGLKKWGWYLQLPEKWKAWLKSDTKVKALEIGAFDGVSANMMLDVLFPNPESEIHCIDLFEHDSTTPEVDSATRDCFLENARIGGHERQLHLYEGMSSEVLGWMLAADGYWESFDFIYIDGSHVAPAVLTDACQAWTLLKRNGIMIFDDYEWEGHPHLLFRPKLAIDAFLGVFDGCFETVHKGGQVVVRKL